MKGQLYDCLDWRPFSNLFKLTDLLIHKMACAIKLDVFLRKQAPHVIISLKIYLGLMFLAKIMQTVQN